MSKQLVTLAILIFSSFSRAISAELHGFLDFPWGAGLDDASKQIAARSNLPPISRFLP